MEQSLNLPARSAASHGGSLYFTFNKAVGRSDWMDNSIPFLQDLSNVCRHHSPVALFCSHKENSNDVFVNCQHSDKDGIQKVNSDEKLSFLTAVFRSNSDGKTCSMLLDQLHPTWSGSVVQVTARLPDKLILSPRLLITTQTRAYRSRAEVPNHNQTLSLSVS